MNAALSPLQLAQTLAAQFAERAALHDERASFPHDNFSELAAAGLLSLAASPHLLQHPDRSAGLSIALPTQGASLATLSQVIGTLGEACPATALVLAMQYIQHRSLSRASSRWPVQLARRVVQTANPQVALINSLRVEPELGTPARGGLPATTARRSGEGWVLSGRKIYSTGAPGLRWLAVWARTDETPPRVGTFLVDAQRPGVRIEHSWNHLGLRASGSHDIVFEGVHLPADHAVDIRPPQAWQGGNADLQAEMAVFLGQIYSGVARAAHRWTLGFLRERTPASLGAPLATLPRVQEAVGRIERLLTVNALLIAQLAQRVDAGDVPSATESGLVKVQVTEAAVQAVHEALALTSNHGLSRRNPLERHLRDVLCGPVHTPQVDSVHVAAGREALAL
ncbi:acyl-CoA dehydrogenase [Comamonas serinivorans]|uniref:Acyl-CoA dehydrogenase n=1 Tax=Comamonas serinivorans TaxID=1082851 RepID=A0A1Y0ERP8_9BURK|nr:acyl-CoA dehydrogenase [Comamonas serinivorans]ARU05989.1 acyl-CoA dehydrogenase [Comamonas serinivorans]